MFRVHVMRFSLSSLLLTLVACQSSGVPILDMSHQGLALVGSYGTLETEIGDRVGALFDAGDIRITVIRNHGWDIYVPPTDSERARKILMQLQTQHPSLRVH